MAAAYLFTWNPAKFRWQEHWPGDQARLEKRSRDGKSVEIEWSCAKSKLPQRGDRAFLIKLGRYGRGIFASGWLTVGSHTRKEPDFGPRGVEIECDVFLNPDAQDDLFDPKNIKGQHWTPQSSGVRIGPSAYQELERLWPQHLRDLRRKPVPCRVADQDDTASFEFEALEGERREYLVKHRRRERALRDKKLLEFRGKYGRLFCEVCDFDFKTIFGVEYAEVHHVKPLGLTEGPQLTRLEDLAVLCANCHRVAHIDPRRARSPEQLRAKMRECARGAARSLPKKAGG
jgi:5-methylcytosine-specific restriction protein A